MTESTGIIKMTMSYGNFFYMVGRLCYLIARRALQRAFLLLNRRDRGAAIIVPQS